MSWAWLGRAVFVLLIIAVTIGGPLTHAWFRSNQSRHFCLVRHGVLYRSGQMTVSGLEQAVRDFRIRTVITLRDPATPEKGVLDAAEQEFCRAKGIRFVRLSPRRWWSRDGSVPAEENVRRFLQIMDDPRHYPVLIHCFAGTHRTGAYCAIFRMEYDYWSNDRALAEMQAHGYRDLTMDGDLVSYLRSYRPRWQVWAEDPLSRDEEAEPGRRP
ncbi:MAG: tyrosine-protein phosphatase [Gemmataceae bacterium]|nr:tyrosine-protein phosphatase [Gemmataceae bacterium]